MVIFIDDFMIQFLRIKFNVIRKFNSWAVLKAKLIQRSFGKLALAQSKIAAYFPDRNQSGVEFSYY